MAAKAPVVDASGDAPDTSGDALERLGAVADAVLYEGYLLYPYRRSSPKNRVRWQFGVLFPRDWAEAAYGGTVRPCVSGSQDSWYQETHCLLRVRRPDARLRVRLRYLQTRHKQVERRADDGTYRPVEQLRTEAGDVHLTFGEAVPHERDVDVALGQLLSREHVCEVGAPGGEETEQLPGGEGQLVRRRDAVSATATLSAEQVVDDVVRLRIRTENTGSAPDPTASREEALRVALVATHTLLTGDGVDFVSLIDPPAELRAAAHACRNAFTFPVLGGAPAVSKGSEQFEQSGPAVLSAPIILPDHPQVAPESPGDLHDAGEIDEILTLRTMLLTDEEKREARATDRRAAEIVDRVDNMPQEVFSRLHGAIRSLEPAGRMPNGDHEDTGTTPRTTVLIDGVPVGPGSRVRLRPRARGTDAQDMFLAGRAAHVAKILRDVDGSIHLAVTVDDDPAAELNGWYGRFHHFRTTELVPLAPDGPPDEAEAL